MNGQPRAEAIDGTAPPVGGVVQSLRGTMFFRARPPFIIRSAYVYLVDTKRLREIRCRASLAPICVLSFFPVFLLLELTARLDQLHWA